MVTNLDSPQVIKAAFDETTGELKVKLNPTELIIDHSTDSIKVGDGVKTATITTVGGNNAIDVNVVQTVGGGGSVVDVTPTSPVANDYLPVRLTDGTNFYVAGGSGGGGTSLTDKGTFVEGTTPFVPVGGVYNETIASDPTEDQGAAARITAKRAIHTNLRNASGTEIATSGNPLRTDPTGTTAQPITDNGGSLTVDGAVSVNNGSGGSAVNIQDGGNSITVDGSISVSNFPATQPVSGTVTTNLGTIAGVSTETTLAALNTKVVTFDLDSGVGTQNIPGISLRKTASGGSVELGTSSDPIRTDPTGITTQPVSGSISISNFPASQAVTGPLTDTQLRATAVPVSGPLTDTQLRATAVPVSGTVAVSNSFALDATITGGTAQTKITDGTNVATVKAASTAAVATDKAVVVAVSPNNSVAVTGTVTSNQGTNNATPWNENVAQINGVTPLMGNGVTGTGSLRVTVASDNTAFGVNAIQSGTWTVQPGNTANTTAWRTEGRPSTIATYAASFQALTPPAAATNMIQIRGSATKIVRIHAIMFAASATAAGAQNVFLRKQSAADTGGTFTAVSTNLVTNSARSGATATLGHYTVSPTSLGAAVNTIICCRIFFQITAGTAVFDPTINLIEKAGLLGTSGTNELFTLNGIAESLSVSNNAAALAAGYKIDNYVVVWSEE